MSDAKERMVIREELTNEWHKRGIESGQEYSMLTSEIAKATFGMTPSRHKSLKGLKRQSLREHMTSLEQTFSMLGEALATEIIRREDAKGFWKLRSAVRRGGAVAGIARRQLEKVTGQPVVSTANHLLQSKQK